MELLRQFQPAKKEVDLTDLLRQPNDSFNVYDQGMQEQRKRSDEFLTERLKELEAKGVFVI